MGTGKSRRLAVAIGIVAMLFSGACNSEPGVSEDPQGPAENAPGTEGPQPTPS